ncbi:MAG: response regulator transcription factor [Verrucomicrobiales bacterium]
MTILLADDDPITLEALDACLRSDGYSTVLAKDGQAALEAWRSESHDLLCLDIMMPRINGYDVCRQVRAVDPFVPLLFLSAKSEEIDVVVGLHLGADDFLRKPFGKHELLARIRAALRRSQNPARAAAAFQLRDLIVYPKELRAVRDGRDIELTPREVSLLKVLHEHSGEAVSRDTLLDRCWGLEYYPESRTLDQHIANLRKRIERDPATPEIIESIRGVGYRYRA